MHYSGPQSTILYTHSSFMAYTIMIILKIVLSRGWRVAVVLVRDIAPTFVVSCDGNVMLDPKMSLRGWGQNNSPWGKLLASYE